MIEKLTRKTVAKGGAWATCLGLLLTTLTLYVNSIPPHSQEASCKFNMSRELKEVIEDIEMVHNEFKHCLFNATEVRKPTFKIQQLTALLDSSTRNETSFQIYFDVSLYEQWLRNQLEAHVRHLFMAHIKTYCTYSFTLAQGTCQLKSLPYMLKWTVNESFDS